MPYLAVRPRDEDEPLDTEKPLWHKAVDNLKHFASAQASLQDELAEAHRDLSHVRSDYLQLGLRCSALASERDALRQRLAQMQEYLDTLQTRIDSGGGEADQALRAQLTELHSELDRAGQKYVELESQLADSRRTIEALQDRIAGDQARETELSAELQKRLDDITAAHAELNTAYLERDRLANALEDELALLRSELNQLQDSKRDLETSLAERDQQTEELQRRATELQVECDATAPRLKSLETAVEEAGSALKKAEEQIGDLQWQLGEKSTGYETLRENLVVTETERKKLLSKESELSESLRKTRQQLQLAYHAAETQSQARKRERRVMGILLAVMVAVLAVVLLGAAGL